MNHEKCERNESKPTTSFVFERLAIIIIKVGTPSHGSLPAMGFTH
jgi:hypothetical protein